MLCAGSTALSLRTAWKNKGGEDIVRYPPSLHGEVSDLDGLAYRTNGKTPVKDKPKIFFACHKEDFDDAFPVICEDIFLTHDCTIFYREEQSEALWSEEGMDAITQMNLFIFPVTKKLLTSPCLAMEKDLPMALSHSIRVLPIVFEMGAGRLPEYGNYFGTMQYLDRTGKDDTEVPYAKKLKDFLDDTLLDDETATRIRQEFDAYLFLSYRKKDRKFANELMRKIHRDRRFLSVAIWYDEYLVPGEQFDLSIQKAMDKSKLFLLLVTPSLLEKNEDGEANYVQRIEYPRAKEAGMPVLPIEMIEVDEVQLRNCFKKLPEVIAIADEKRLYGVLVGTVDQYIRHINDCTERFYLLGMAYLNGCDMEINRELGIELLSVAGEAGNILAMERLVKIYSWQNMGKPFPGQSKYNEKALYWMRKQYEYYKSAIGEANEKTLRLLFELGEEDRSLTRDQRKEIYLKCMEYGKKVFREDDLFLLDVLTRTAAFAETPQERYRICEKAFLLACKRYGKNKDEKGAYVVDRYDRLSFSRAVQYMRDQKQALNILEESYANRCACLGADDRSARRLLKLIETMRNAGTDKQDVPASARKSEQVPCGQIDETEVKANIEKECLAYRKYLKEKQYTAAEMALSRALWACARAGDLERRKSILEEACEEEGSRFYDENMSPKALAHLEELATVYERLGDTQNAARFTQKARDIRKKQGKETSSFF